MTFFFSGLEIFLDSNTVNSTVAIYIDEYVPAIRPNNIAKLNVNISFDPKNISEITGTNVVTDV